MLTSNDGLLSNHDEFRKLAQEHLQYSTRLDSLTQKRYLSEDEKLEEDSTQEAEAAAQRSDAID